jgi:hypothetical protein
MKRSPFVQIAMILCFSLGSVSIVTGSFLLKKALSTTGETQTITDTSRYQEIRQKLWFDSQKIKHFPVDIPPDAQSVNLAYSPANKSGASFLQIRYKQSPTKIQHLLSHYRHLATHRYMGGDTNDHINLPQGVPTTFFYTSKTTNISFPSTYEILVLNAEKKGISGFKWNHGNSYGVAIDRSTAEIVYWAEKW